MAAPIAAIAGGEVRFNDFTLQIGDLHLDRKLYRLIGPNGAGKTTLLRVLLGLQPLTAGTVEINVSNRGYLPQNYRDSLFPWLSVERNLRLFQSGGDFIDLWTGRLGLDVTELGRRAQHLSGGQAQRLALIRESALRCDLLVLDEPFSALDVNASAAAGEMIRHLREEQDTAIVIVTHAALPETLAEAEIETISIRRDSDEICRVRQA